MKLDYAFFAGGAEVSPDGRLHVFGGEIGGVSFPSFPSSPMDLHLVIKLLASPSEAGRKRTVTLTCKLRGDDPAIQHRQDITIDPIGNQLDDTAESGLIIIARMALRFDQPGVHEFGIEVDGVRLRSVPFYVSAAPQDSDETAMMRTETVKN